MPELPEVETIVRELGEKISGRKLEKISVFDKKRLGLLRPPLPLEISSVDRHGKYIVMHSDGGPARRSLGEGGKILIHLRMSGRLIFSGTENLPVEAERGERVRFYFSGGSTSLTAGNSVLRFFDPRRFGTVEWKKEKMPELGLNPLEPEFNDKNFKEAVFSRSRAIKSLLLDQKVISGLGNIYADESLWFAKISPFCKSDSLSEKEASLLRESIVKVLRMAISKGGFTMRDYRKTGGESGSYQLFRKVYKREGLLCSRCGGKIKRIKIGGRSARLCPKCQK